MCGSPSSTGPLIREIGKESARDRQEIGGKQIGEGSVKGGDLNWGNERRAVAATSARVSTGENEVRQSKGVLFVHQNVMYSLKYNYFLFHIRIEITFMFLFRGLRSEQSVLFAVRAMRPGRSRISFPASSWARSRAVGPGTG